MKGGRRIDDHSFMGLKKSKDSCCPDGVHVKHFEQAKGSGDVYEYQDDQREILDAQNKNDKMIEKQRHKEEMRQ
jgi:hypothetical protein